MSSDVDRARREQEKKSAEFVEAIRALKVRPEWVKFRDTVLEQRIKTATLQALKPANTEEQVRECERSKGALIALQSLLHLFEQDWQRLENTDDDD